MTRRVLALVITTVLIIAAFGLTTGTRAQDDGDDFDDLQATSEANSEALDAQQTEIAALQTTAEAHEATIDAQQTEIAALDERVAAVETAVAPTTPATGEQNEATVEVATPVSDEVVLYEADATGGFDEWTGSADWIQRDGQLLNDGTTAYSSIVAPYQPSVSDYAVEAEIRRVRCDSGPSQQQGFGIVARAEERGGYWGGQNCVTNGDSDYAVIWAATQDENEEVDRLATQEYTFDPEWHTYRLEVRGNTLRLFVDDAPVLETGDVRYAGAGQVGLWSIVTPIEVRSFRVLAL